MRLLRLRNFFALVALATAAVASTASAAFIVEPRSGGKAFANFSTGGDTGAPSNSTTSGGAAGLTPGIGSIFGGMSATMDQYVYSYTPGVNLDNTVFLPGADLGQGNSATGLVGGLPGLYNVYATFPTSNNISNDLPTGYVATSDGGPVAASINQSTDVNPTIGDDWVLIGSVMLTPGTTYTVTQTAPNSLFVSMRSAGVMWEFVAIPEPATLSLAALGMIGLVADGRRALYKLPLKNISSPLGRLGAAAASFVYRRPRTHQ